MMEQKAFRNYSLLAQAGLWFALFMIYFMEETEYSGIGISVLYGFCVVATFAFVVYGHYYLIFPVFIAGRKWLYFILIALLVVGMGYFRYLFDYYFPYDYEYTPSILDVIYYAFLVMIFIAVSSLYYFVDAWYINFKKESLLRSEKLQAELNFLKSQINPHFLFNTLNNIYSYAQTNNPKTAPMLERLSSILRFMVYDCSDAQVIFNKEISAIEDLLEIYKMKNSEQRNIKLEVQGVKGFHLIAPLIVINFVENACKHSDAVSNKNGFIYVHIHVNEEDICHVHISNSIKKKAKNADQNGGVGLQNIKKRLELQYQDEYQMSVKTENDIYDLTLEIPLQKKQ